MFNLDKSEDVRRYVVKRKVEKNGKVRYKSPKIQRLVTPLTLQRKRARRAFKLKRRIASAAKKAAYEELLHKRRLEARSLKQE
jgi:small subunit ribosomal protein S6e